MYILDTNILIYAFQEQQKILGYLKELHEEQFFISAISRFEVMLGGNKEDVDYAEKKYFRLFPVLPVDAMIADTAARIYHKKKKILHKDSLIAATAIEHKATLITADREFLKFPELKVCLLEL